MISFGMLLSQIHSQFNKVPIVVRKISFQTTVHCLAGSLSLNGIKLMRFFARKWINICLKIHFLKTEFKLGNANILHS